MTRAMLARVLHFREQLNFLKDPVSNVNYPSISEKKNSYLFKNSSLKGMVEHFLHLAKFINEQGYSCESFEERATFIL